jgi:ADP-ribose pyrophosphatase YjhB (NUDIX family)
VTWTTLTGAGAIVERAGRLLLVRQRRPYGVHWEFPSGYYEPGESFEEAAAREALEETAIAVDIAELVCTMVWEREHDHRRNLLAYFLASPRDAAAQPRGQVEEDIDDAAFIDPAALGAGEVHPYHAAIVERWWDTRETGFHLHADVTVNADGTQSYRFRS